MVVDEQSEVIFRSRHGNQFFGQNRPPIHVVDISSRAVHEISAYGEKYNHRPVNISVLLIGP